MRRIAVVAAMAGVLAACTSADDRPQPRPSGAVPVAYEGQLLRCDGRPFPVTVFDAPPGVEAQGHALSEALIATLAEQATRIEQRTRIVPAPDSGWRLLYENDREAQFARGDPPHLIYLTLRRSDGRWGYADAGRCTPEVWRTGLRPAPWALDAEAHDPEVDPTTTTLHVWVSEATCTGGEVADDRLTAPEVSYTAETLTITFFVEPLPPGYYTCQGVRPTSRVVHLAEPLGDRMLLDGWRYPPRPPKSSKGLF